MIVDDVGDKNEKDLLSLYQRNENSRYAMINYEDSVFVPKDVDGYRQKDELNLMVEKYKKEIAKKYYDIASVVGVDRLAWVDELV